ncbi:Hypothetical protein FKW44_015159 [Caligus rogercresseyi]|uniref:Uncharacterized protein n=1 Tax=Caligus rogercresseyi TaxID=217165 RepID=A0A7T8H0K6_CALRO|nr:Hypothetical protein FKW44_015159 [Caligus rogercresseyi]
MPSPGGAYKHKSGSQKRKQKKEEADKIAKLPKLNAFLKADKPLSLNRGPALPSCCCR